MRQLIAVTSITLTQGVRRTCLICATLALAACGRQSTMDEQMQRDLEAASAGSIELAPSGAGTNVVSAVESKQPVQPKVAPVRRVSAPAPVKTPPPEITQPVQTSNEPVANRPVSRPAVQPPPPGGYKSVNEVIRNAPFPIKPATTTRRP
jgi:hypothetical protein